MNLIKKEEEIISKYLGVPHRTKGRCIDPKNEKAYGLDCYGLIVTIYADIDYQLLDWEDVDYDEEMRLEQGFVEENYHKQWEKISEPEVFDVVLLKGVDKNRYHAGVVLRNGRFIHTSKAGTAVSRLDEPRWKSRIVGYYRYKEKDVSKG